MVDPNFQLNDADRASLAGLCSSDGFSVFQKLCESEISKFTVNLLNADAADNSAIIAAHKVAKAAAQFYTGIIRRMNDEVTALYNTPRVGEVIPDTTDDLLG